MQGNLEPMAHYAGQTVGLIKEIKPLAQILDEVIENAVQRIYACQTLLS